MKILPIKPVETLAVRPVAVATLPDRIIPTLGLPPHIVPTLPPVTGNTGIVPPYLLDRIAAGRTAVADARQGADINPGVVPPWMIDGVDSTTDLVAPDGPVDPNTPRIL